MSTRATIKVKDSKHEQFVYHHCDGYPEGVGKILDDYLKLLGKHWDFETIVNHLIKTNGFEYTTGQHGDEEYAYLIDIDASQMICYEIEFDDFNWKEEDIIKFYHYF